MTSNGQLPSSVLSGIPGNARLRKDAARAYTALALTAKAKYGVNMSLWEQAVGRGYRSLDRQRLAWRTYGPGQAAVPGTSNHGWGIAVDLMNVSQRRAVDRVGASYGWAKRWSDAQHEWWHLRWRSGVWKAPSQYRTVKRGSRGSTVTRLQKLLRNKNVKDAPKVTGYFGASTRRAVLRFQRKHNLRADGVVGPTTWRLLRR